MAGSIFIWAVISAIFRIGCDRVHHFKKSNPQKRVLGGKDLTQDGLRRVVLPDQEKKLPIVLNREDVIRIFESVNNIKHKAILMLAYSAGLRVSGVAKLKLQDIDTKRNMIHIKGQRVEKIDI